MRFILCLLCCVAAASAAFVNNFVRPEDFNGFKDLFSVALSHPIDAGSVFFGASGLSVLGEKLPGAKEACEFLKKNVKQNDLENMAYTAGASSILDCKISLPDAEKFLAAAIKDDAATKDLYHAAFAQKSLGQKVDAAKLKAALLAATKKDNSAASLGYGFHAASLLTDAFPLLDRIEDAVAQADEVDGTYLQYDGGLSVTATVVTAIFKLSEKANKAPTMKGDDVVKFTNYLLNRRGVRVLRPAYWLLSALKELANNKFFIPVSLSLASSVSTSPKEPNVQLRVSNCFGQALPASVTVTLDTATHTATTGVVLTKKQLTPVSGDASKTLFEFKFFEQKLEKGFYKLAISASSTDKRLVGLRAEITVKALSQVSVSGVEIAAVDREQTSTANALKLEYPKLHSTVIDADTHQKITMKFQLKDTTSGQPVKVHQAFVVFSHSTKKQEITFVAEADTAKFYKFDADLQKSAKDFDFLSGRYHCKLVVGDATIENPFMWHMLDVNLKFPTQEKPSKSAEAIHYEKRPEIIHMFRQPEVRPSQVVSTAFTALVLLPLLLLLILWLRIGINISNFPFSLASLGFQLGIAGIFGLYFVFWLQLNMFQTLKYLSFVALFTAFCGNNVLRALAEKRKAKTE